MTTQMDPTIDRMLNLTADIAEELLQIKDSGDGCLPDGLKLKIISLAEIAATTGSCQPDEASSSTEEAEEAEEAEEMESAPEETEPEEVVEEQPAESEPDRQMAVEDDVCDEEADEVAVEEEVGNDDTVFEVEEDVAEEETSFPSRRIDVADIYHTFSINDVFLYRREIFGGSQSRFLDALDRVSMLPDRHALQDYLVRQLNLNLNESPGKDFYQSLAVFF